MDFSRALSFARPQKAAMGDSPWDGWKSLAMQERGVAVLTDDNRLCILSTNADMLLLSSDSDICEFLKSRTSSRTPNKISKVYDIESCRSAL